MQGSDGAPLELFYSYSHDDEEYRKKLGKHLSVLRRAGLITDWHDRDIDAGTAWQEEIDRHLLSADIVLLLVSASFIASDYCWGDEMTKALARHKDGKARVIPIILHPCGWLMTPLKALQGLPRDNKAVSLWPNEHAAFDHVVTEIAKVVDDLRRRKGAEPELVEQASAVAVVASAPSESPAPPHPPADAGPSLSRRERETPPAEEWGTPPAKGSLSRRERGGVRVDPHNLPDFTVFRDVDAPWCPEMAVIPVGQFLMSSPPDERERSDWEGPQRRVTTGYRFAIGRYAVTFAEYDHFCKVTGREKPPDQAWGRGRQPVINVSWRDAKAYIEWLSRDTGQTYRLPSEAEWEYACRAGTTTPFSFGETITQPGQLQRQPHVCRWCEGGIYRKRAVEVGSLPANAWGLYELHGNVWEWLEDVWHDSYSDAPVDGSAWTEGEGLSSDRSRVVRGGSWLSYPWLCRSAYRYRYGPVDRDGNLGFRLSRTLY